MRGIFLCQNSSWHIFIQSPSLDTFFAKLSIECLKTCTIDVTIFVNGTISAVFAPWGPTKKTFHCKQINGQYYTLPYNNNVITGWNIAAFKLHEKYLLFSQYTPSKPLVHKHFISPFSSTEHDPPFRQTSNPPGEHLP